VSTTDPPDAPAEDHAFETGWLDRSLYPFESHCVGLDDGAVHYVDEGPADPAATLLFLHGNPTWSFLYRHLVAGLADEYRCVALDYLGFGLSARPEGFDYRPSSHARVVADFVAELDLRDVVPVVHDWGGPIGFAYALDHPENVRGFVVTNTTMWPVDDDTTVRWFSRLVGGPVGRRLCERFDLFGRVVLPGLFADRSRLPPAVHRHYLAPHPAPASRRGTWVFPRALVGESAWLQRLWSRRDRVADHLARLVWGMADPGFGPGYLRTFEALFDDPSVVRRRGVGHYVPEELGPTLVPHVRSFLGGLE
jgi:haloalkane dehalogenase